MYHTKLFSSATLPVVVLLLLSLLLRGAYSISHISFGQDIARDSWLIQQMINQNDLIAEYGPKASVGNFYLPPLYYQLHVFFSFIFQNHPLIMKWVITIVESFSPVVLFLILREYLSKQYAFGIASLAIIAHAPLQYGTMAWNPNMIPFLSLSVLYSGIQLMSHQRKQFALALPILALSAFQLHYHGAVLFLFTFILLVWSLFRYKQAVFRFWIIGILLALVSITPYFVAEIQSNFNNTRSIFNFFSQEHTQYFDRVSKPAYVLTYFPQFFDRILLGKASFHGVIGFAIYFGGLIFLLYSIYKQRPTQIQIFLYLITIFIMLRIFKGDKLDYYLSMLYYVPFLFLGLIYSHIPWKRVKTSLIMLFLFIFAFNYGKQPSYNELEKLRFSVHHIVENSVSNSVRLLFHDDDYVNTLFFGITKYSSLQIDQTSATIVDICNPKDVCVWDNTPQSKHSIAYSEVALYKHDAKYAGNSILFGYIPFQVGLGTVAIPSIKHDTSKFVYQGEQGSDFLIDL